MSSSFHEFVRLLQQDQESVDSSLLHGLLTGCATIPTINYESLFDAIAPGQSLPEDAVEALCDAIDQIAEDLSVGSFEASFDIHRNRWAKPARFSERALPATWLADGALI